MRPLLLFFFMFLLSCGGPHGNGDPYEHYPRIDVNHRSSGDTLYISGKNGNNMGLRTYTIEGCEWLGDLGNGTAAQLLAHKGTCKYCKARHLEEVMTIIELYKEMEAKKDSTP